eukprot:GFUD01011259.1.p1 GENE.GFUD01011259.1~~GFUD01011259.1.p1  ORF type:complete len:490 (+),score=83.89 GFUD01011259.1:50-1519(+)
MKDEYDMIVIIIGGVLIGITYIVLRKFGIGPVTIMCFSCVKMVWNWLVATSRLDAKLVWNWLVAKLSVDTASLLVEKEKVNWSKKHDLLPKAKRDFQLEQFKNFRKQLRMCYYDVEIDGHKFQQHFVTDGTWQIEFDDGKGVIIHNSPMFDEVTTDEFVLTPEVMSRVHKICGGNNYSLVLRNSEHLCRYIRSGAWISFQMARNTPLRAIFENHMSADQRKLINTMPNDLIFEEEPSDEPIYNEVGDYHVQFCQSKEILTDADNDAFNILFLGPTGSGKSTLINHLYNQDVVKAVGSASSVTRSMTYIQGEAMWSEPGKWKKFDKVNIIDSVGFCDTELPPKQVHHMIKNSVKMNMTYIDKVVITCSGRIEEPHYKAIKKFMKWLTYEDHKHNFVFIWNKCDTLSDQEKAEGLVDMSSILGTDLNMQFIAPSGYGRLDKSIKLNHCLGFAPGAPFEEVEKDLQSLKDAVFVRDVNHKRIAVDSEACAIQ